MRILKPKSPEQTDGKIEADFFNRFYADYSSYTGTWMVFGCIATFVFGWLLRGFVGI